MLPGAVDVVMGAGECFPFGALVGSRTTDYPFTADEDCFCWELAAVDFQKAEFARYVTDEIPVVFHVAFDRALLARAMPGWKRHWLDVAELAPALNSGRARACRSLDDWLAAFSIENPARHEAVADAYVTVQQLVLLAEAERQGIVDAGDLFAAQRGRRWLG